MKTKLLTITMLLLSLCIGTTNSFAQGDTGGSAGSSTGSVATQPTAVHFTRNNGDGVQSKAHIKMYYSTAPTCAPVLTEIYYQGQPLFENFEPVTGDISNFASTGYVTFSLAASNIPPAIKLTLTYLPSPACAEVTISGTD